MGGRFLRGLLWGGLVGAAVGIYFFGGREAGPEAAVRRRWRRAAGLEGDGSAGRPSRLRLAWDAGRAAMEATLALLGRRG